MLPRSCLNAWGGRRTGRSDRSGSPSKFCEHLEDAVLGKRRAIDPSNTLGILPLTIGNAKARFVAPIVLSFRS